MVEAELEEKIREMLERGYSYRQIRKALNVGNWTITKVKKEMDLERKLEEFQRVFEESVRSREFIRLMRALLREDAKLTDEKLEDLWDYWSWMELEHITRPMVEWQKMRVLEKTFELYLLGIYQMNFMMEQIFWSLYNYIFRPLQVHCPHCRTVNLYPAQGIRGYPPVAPFYRHYITGR